jgi:hypothetical protein
MLLARVVFLTGLNADREMIDFRWYRTRVFWIITAIGVISLVEIQDNIFERGHSEIKITASSIGGLPICQVREWNKQIILITGPLDDFRALINFHVIRFTVQKKCTSSYLTYSGSLDVVVFILKNTGLSFFTKLALTRYFQSGR